MIKQPWEGIVFSLKKEENSDTCHDLNAPEDIMPNKRSWAPKDQYCVIPLCEAPRIVKIMETESRMVVARGWGSREGRLTL